jgi:hypothetical protein
MVHGVDAQYLNPKLIDELQERYHFPPEVTLAVKEYIGMAAQGIFNKTPMALEQYLKTSAIPLKNLFGPGQDMRQVV